MGFCAGSAGASDDQRDAPRLCLFQDQAQIAFDLKTLDESFAAAEIIRSGIRGSRINADEIQILFQRIFQTDVRIAVAEQSAEGKITNRVLHPLTSV